MPIHKPDGSLAIREYLQRTVMAKGMVGMYIYKMMIRKDMRLHM